MCAWCRSERGHSVYHRLSVHSCGAGTFENCEHPRRDSRQVAQAMTYIEMKRADSVINFFLSILGSVSFGYWQHSVAASGCAYVLLTFIANIGWAVEYGAREPKP